MRVFLGSIALALAVLALPPPASAAGGCARSAAGRLGAGREGVVRVASRGLGRMLPPWRGARRRE